jgi:hypothetical protein
MAQRGFGTLRSLMVVLMASGIGLALTPKSEALPLHIYTASVTVAETPSLQTGLPPYNPATGTRRMADEARLADLARIVRGKDVVARSGKRLARLGVNTAPFDLVDAISVRPDSGTHALVIGVTTDNAADATTAVGVVAQEFGRHYGGLVGSGSQPRGTSISVGHAHITNVQRWAATPRAFFLALLVAVLLLVRVISGLAGRSHGSQLRSDGG